ncbi:MAG TPA: hypothetical protein DCS93_07140 [Microscillaceae bacterium]|nr:hypothetical protein [Microscillaceae bacterium]
MRSLLWILLFGIFIAFIFWIRQQSGPVKLHKSSVELTTQNYGVQVDKFAQEMGLPSAYFKALIVLECSGERPPKSRYERHVYKRLYRVKKGKRKRYGSITKKTLRKFSNGQLKDLATSWGPLQIMGYQSLAMKIPVSRFKEEFALYYSMQWVKNTYGNYLKKGDYANAFHIHNTGKPLPASGRSRTYDPNYIKKGLKYIKIFEDKENKEPPVLR